MIKCVLEIYIIMEKYGKNHVDLFIAFYEASRLNCWMIALSPPVEQNAIINHLTQKLNS